MTERRWTVVQLLPAMDAGGAERSTVEIGRALVAAGHRSVVISAGGRLVDQLCAEGSEHLALPIAHKSLRTLAQVGALRRELTRLQPDLLHLRSRLPAWLARFALRGRALPTVSTVHGLNSVGYYSAILTRADRVIAVSQTSADYLRSHYPALPEERLRVISRGVQATDFPVGFSADDQWRARFFAEFPRLAGGGLLTLPGRGTRLKGHVHALTLLAALRQRGMDVRLLLLGADQPGRERYLAELGAQATALGVGEYWQATVSRADVREVYAISDLILQLSDHPESFGRTVAEALHQGRPVLGWDLGGVGEQLRACFAPGAVPLGDHAALADRAAELLDHPQPDKIRREAIPTVETMQRATLAVYAELLGNPQATVIAS